MPVHRNDDIGIAGEGPARVGYETAVQTWSFVTMPIMAGFTSFAFHGDYVNPGFRLRGDRP